ncbi:hypothetical protein 101112UKE3-1_175 [Escherichia phage vB_EcoM-101112UKE3-1]|nr:hypothetical protein 101112UKE3-1_175 [Escherichia phage vB_EcoM-101112UKE3-1]
MYILNVNDDGFMVILVVKYPKTYVPLEGLRRQCQ